MEMQPNANTHINKNGQNMTLCATDQLGGGNNSDVEDALDCIKDSLKWRGDIGYLPGSACRFKMNEFGEILLADKFEHIRKKQKLITENIVNDPKPGNEFSICANCKSFDFKDEFLKNGKYCSDCSNLNPQYTRMVRTLFTSDTNDTNSNQPMEYLNGSESKTFSWDAYLKKNGFVHIPSKSFLPTQIVPTKVNRFEIGMKLEGIDPYHPSRFCVLTITQIQGVRLRLHFDGYKRKYDFFVNSNSEFIFPPGFCKSSKRVLEPPGGMTVEQFNWDKYLTDNNARAAPAECFVTPREDEAKITAMKVAGFVINRKLEAVDKANSNLICVCSIKDILNDYLLIHFDGWDDSYDYWAHHTSSLIHPINWCKMRGKCLTPPNGFTGSFVWDDYLQQTDTIAVPTRAFKPKTNSSTWRTGMKLEAVDIRNQQLIRVATIASRDSHTVKIHFDGWSDKYDYWIDDDCPNLHPINWCQQTNHPLQPPPNNETKSQAPQSCTIPNCNGIGHRKWYLYSKHSSANDCPYYTEHLDFNEPPDRYASSSEESEDETSDDEMEPKEEIIEENLNPIQFKGEDLWNESEFENFSVPIIRNEQKNEIAKLSESFISSRKGLFSKKDLTMDTKKILSWNYMEVENFVYQLTGCSEAAKILSEQHIDGEALLLLKRDDLTKRLNIKLGPAAKIHFFILGTCLSFYPTMFNNGDR